MTPADASPMPKKTARLWFRHPVAIFVGLWLLSALLIWQLFAQTELDAWATGLYVGRVGEQAIGFPLKEHWALTKLSHLWVKRLCILSGVIAGAGWVASWWWVRFREWRWPGGFVLLAMSLSPSLIGLIKRHSHHTCPWDLTQYGGTWQKYALFDTVPELSGPGRCLPGGHASSGFALLAFYFVARAARLPHAWLYAAAALIIGFAMGWAQIMRGAHFLSHNVWSLWWTIGIQTLAYVGMTHWAQRKGRSLAAPPGMLSR